MKNHEDFIYWQWKITWSLKFEFFLDSFDSIIENIMVSEIEFFVNQTKLKSKGIGKL